MKVALALALIVAVCVYAQAQPSNIGKPGLYCKNEANADNKLCVEHCQTINRGDGRCQDGICHCSNKPSLRSLCVSEDACTIECIRDGWEGGDCIFDGECECY